MREQDAAALRDFLANRDVPCPGCGYNLRGLTGGRCPECAQHLELRVGANDAGWGGFIAGVIGLASGAGFSGLLLLYLLIHLAISTRSISFVAGFLIITAAGAAIHTLLLVAWLRRRSAFRQRTPAARRAMVVGCWSVTFVNLVVFTYLIR